jgi:hypothetical protein
MLIKEICAKWFMWVLKNSKKDHFNLINWVLVFVKDFELEHPKISFIEH